MVGVKICGINDAVSLKTAIDYGADMVGLVFVEDSPRYVSIDDACAMLVQINDFKNTALVGLFVNATDDFIHQVITNIGLDYIQFHGCESLDRIIDIKANIGQKIIKAIGISEWEDFELFHQYRPICDMVLCDAKPPKGDKRAGGHGIAIDWSLFAEQSLGDDWLLAGGLHIGNIAQALAQTNAPFIDLSSGVEDKLGKKSPQKIKALLEYTNKYR